jgi:sugar O-acyltransferase (sialic acid O-acetyltransferase NeuD family)
MIKQKLVLFPFNGNGLEALDCIDKDKYDFLGFIDDDPNKTSSQYNLVGRSILNRHKEVFVLAVPGSPISFRSRSIAIDSLNLSLDRFVTIIHPNASLGKNVKIGTNCLIMAGVVITSNATLNNHICVLPNSVIHHDVSVQDYTLIGSNVVIAGGTAIGSNCYIGSGTNIRNNVEIGDQSLIGLGSNVVNNIPCKMTVAGNPARVFAAKV